MAVSIGLTLAQLISLVRALWRRRSLGRTDWRRGFRRGPDDRSLGAGSEARLGRDGQAFGGEWVGIGPMNKVVGVASLPRSEYC